MTIRHSFGGFVIVALLVAFVAVGTTAQGQETGTLRMQLVYEGSSFKPSPINVNKDVQFCGKHDLANERLIINPVNNGIKNAVVYYYGGRSTPDWAKSEPVNETHVLANQNCRFEPRIVVAQVGDTIKVTNPDPVGHNANMNFIRNDPVNFTVATNQEKDVLLTEPEPAPIPVECNIHPWMKAYIVVFDHPFVAVSDEDGVIEIEGLPVGEELTFRINHEAGRIDEVTIDGEKESWRRSRFDITLKAGVNDLGKVLVPAESLSAD